MPPPIRITEADLRQAMRDPRYWRSGNPEQQAFGAWVTEGYRGLYPRNAAPRSSVWVKPYTREGHEVAGHWRRAPEDAGDSAADGTTDIEDRSDIIEANWRRSAWEWLRRTAPDGRGSGGRPGTQPAPPRRKWPGRDGRDRVDDIRNDSATQRLPDAHSASVPQYSRPGGVSGRQRDLEAMDPVGPPTPNAQGGLQYALRDGRMATVRQASGARSNNEPTIEVFEPGDRPGRWRAVDLFRYPPSR